MERKKCILLSFQVIRNVVQSPLFSSEVTPLFQMSVGLSCLPFWNVFEENAFHDHIQNKCFIFVKIPLSNASILQLFCLSVCMSVIASLFMDVLLLVYRSFPLSLTNNYRYFRFSFLSFSFSLWPIKILAFNISRRDCIIAFILAMFVAIFNNLQFDFDSPLINMTFYLLGFFSQL